MTVYLLSAEMAITDLIKLCPQQVALSSGGFYNEEKNILTLRFLDKTVSFNYQNSLLSWHDSGEKITTVDSIAILHYLVQAKGDKPTGELLAYRQLWGAGAQSGPFIARPEKILAEKFSSNPSLIKSNAIALGAKLIAQDDDCRLELMAFPHLPISVLLYAPDEELPAGAKILYDSIIEKYLPTEDVVWLSSHIAERLTVMTH